MYISGRVQGVFYRSHTKEKADQLSLGGWVRNLNDGRVEAVFEGTPESVDQIISWCEKGPPSSEVTHVDIQEEPHTGDFSRFSIRY
ncbi:MAG: acylphosphatase [Syntrophales bacterium]|jgi:acylphosphatase|nr:acylphosphatase [Syntrophales bacterium]